MSVLMHYWSGQLIMTLLDRDKGALSKTLVSRTETQLCLRLPTSYSIGTLLLFSCYANILSTMYEVFTSSYMLASMHMLPTDPCFLAIYWLWVEICCQHRLKA